MAGCNSSGFADLAGRGIEFLPRPADQSDLGPMLRESLRDGEIDPASATRDDSGFSVKQFLCEYFRHQRFTRILVENRKPIVRG